MYDFSKSTDPLQPLASHITSLLARETPKTSDIVVTSGDRSFALHKFVLAARSPYFRTKLVAAPETTSFRVPSSYPPQSFDIAIRYVYLGELPGEVGSGVGSGFSEDEILEGIDKISRHLEIPRLWDGILEINDRRLARQNRTQETERARDQLENWFERSVLRHKLKVGSGKADDVRWDRANSIYADVLLRADDSSDELDDGTDDIYRTEARHADGAIGSLAQSEDDVPKSRSTLYPAHRAMLIRSEYFQAMFSSPFLEAQEASYLRIIPIGCSSKVLEAVLRYIYTERADFSLEIATDVLFAADLLLMDRLKAKAALVISTLGNGSLPIKASQADPSSNSIGQIDDQNPLDPFQVLRAAWLLRVPRLEEFAARYIAYRLEQYTELPEFADAINESASRIKNRQETDSIELVDDIRHYLSERFRLRFEGEGLEEMLGEADVQQHSNESTHLDTNHAAQEAEAYQFGNTGGVRTLDGNTIAGDEFASEAFHYQMLLEKIEALLGKLHLDG